MPLDRRLVPIIKLMALADSRDPSIPITVRRERSARLSHLGATLVMHREPDPAATTHDYVPVEGGHIMVRLYRPHRRGPFPAYVFLHGGGWCEGTLDERDARCRAICAGAECLVVSVDYRLAPENRFPTAPEDCYAALCWVADNAERLEVDPARIAIGGESAGGNLAAVVCLMTRDREGPRLCHQWLDVPATDLTLSQSGFREVPDGYDLDKAAIDEYTALYLPDMEMVREPYCSPLLADDLSGLPPAWIMTGEFDKLRGDGEAYAAALNAAGVEAQHVRLSGHVHASFAYTRLLPSARAYQRDAVAALTAAFNR